MFKAIGILVLMLLITIAMFLLIIFIQGGPSPKTSVEFKKTRLQREKDRKPTPKVQRNWTLAGQGEGCPFPGTNFGTFVRTELANATAGVFPSKSFFETDLTSKCSVSVFPPRQITVVEISRTAWLYIVDVALEPMEVIVEIPKDELGKEIVPNTAQYWYLYPGPLFPFECRMCRSQVSIELSDKMALEYYLESVGTLTNEFPTFIDVRKPETIRRAYKENFETSLVSAKGSFNIHLVDMSYSAQFDTHLLVGLSPLFRNKTQVSYFTANQSVTSTWLDLQSGTAPKVHYALCVSNFTSTFIYQVNCYPNAILVKNSNGSVTGAAGECICWATSSIKAVFLYSILSVAIILVILALLWRTIKFRRKPVEKVGSGFERTKCKFIYNVYVRLALESTRRIRGNLYMKFVESEDKDITSFVINEKDKFSKPFLGSNEVAELTVKLLSEKQLTTPKEAHIVYTAEDDKYDTLYFFGVVFSNMDRTQTAIFPYSHNLGDQRLARLCEACVWRRKLRAVEGTFIMPELPVASAPSSMTVLEHTYMILASCELLPRSIFMGIDREDNIIFTVFWTSTVGVVLYFLNYALYTLLIRRLFVDRYFLAQAVNVQQTVALCEQLC